MGVFVHTALVEGGIWPYAKVRDKKGPVRPARAVRNKRASAFRLEDFTARPLGRQ